MLENKIFALPAVKEIKSYDYNLMECYRQKNISSFPINHYAGFLYI